MFLKALEIQGFKSFPDRTRITVGKGITAVVGPNGSGKSNISDAIRWVMGETSAKQLRGGGKMENVIFGGTQQRGAMGFASVSLVVDNTDRRIDVDNDEVTIGRKYYRSGDSEYSVNGQNVRLKDIYEMFLDTGLGRDGYSVIGQGRIAEIVGAKSNERREIFEEASGIAKYRYRKNEAERRLASAEENLVRLRDILGELEERVGPLERVSKKAKQYLELAERRKGLEVTLWVDTVQKARDTVREQQRKIEIAGADYARAGREIEAIDAETESTRAEIEHLITEADRCNAEIRAITEEIAGADSRIAVLENDIAHNDATIASLKEEIGQSGLGREAIAAEVRGHGEGIAACERQAAAYAARTGELEALLEELQKSLHLTMLFISHDLSVVRCMTDRAVVMYLGKIMEMGPTEHLFGAPAHPYTRNLIDAVPEPDPDCPPKESTMIGEPPSPMDIPGGCRFHPRCPYAKNVCRRAQPELTDLGGGHFAACHFPYACAGVPQTEAEQ